MKKSNGPRRSKVKREQPKKDNRTRRVNLDNERISKFDSDDDRASKDPRSMRRTKGSNDVRWYSGNNSLTRSATSWAWTRDTGMPFPFNPSFSVPGVMNIIYTPVLGGGDSPINQAKNEIYSYTVHANSRTQTYESADEMQLIIAGANVFTAIALGMRAYGIMRQYQQQDRYTPKALLQAMGFDPLDLQSNYSHMWFDINQLIAMSRQIWIPNVLPVIERWFWMNSQIFRDGSSVKAQYYLYTPSVFFEYGEQAAQLTPRQWYPSPTGTSTNNYFTGAAPKTTLNKWSDYINMVNQLIDKLLASQDRGIIFGDILKAYGSDGIFAMADMDVNYTVEPVYDREVLSQIENAVPFYIDPSQVGPVRQNLNNGVLYHQLMGITATTGYQLELKPNLLQLVPPKYIFMNFHQLEDPTPEQIIVASRMIASGIKIVDMGSTGTAGDLRALMPISCGTEVVSGLDMFYYISSQNGLELTKQSLSTAQSMQAFLYISFDWAPGLWRVSAPESNVILRADSLGQFSNYWNVPDDLISYKILDYDNYSMIGSETLAQMHTAAIYSEYGLNSK